MPVTAIYRVDIDPQEYENINFTLRESGFKVKTQTDTTSAHNFMLCEITTKGASEALGMENFVENIKGVKKIIPMFQDVEERFVWYKKPIMGIAISSAVTSILIYSTLAFLPLHLSNSDLAKYIGLPVLGTFLTQILFRYFPQIHKV